MYSPPIHLFDIHTVSPIQYLYRLASNIRYPLHCILYNTDYAAPHHTTLINCESHSTLQLASHDLHLVTMDIVNPIFTSFLGCPPIIRILFVSFLRFLILYNLLFSLSVLLFSVNIENKPKDTKIQILHRR